jgi:uridine kinase
MGMMLMLDERLQPVIALLTKDQSKPVLIVAIDGHSAAGKSTLARAIANTLPSVTIVQMDDFYRSLDEEERSRLDAEGGYHQYYDWQRLEEQVLKPLAIGEDCWYQKYDWSTNRLGEWAQLQATGIVVVEGCYATRPELRHYYDVVLFVETPAARRLQRQVERADATAAWLARWDAAEHFYMEHYYPDRDADLVIAGE